MFTNQIPLVNSMHAGPFPGDIPHPRLDRAGTKLSYCNGEIGAGSSNITPYMVWACKRPRWVAHTLQQMDGFSVEKAKEVGEAREQDKASASG